MQNLHKIFKDVMYLIICHYLPTKIDKMIPGHLNLDVSQSKEHTKESHPFSDKPVIFIMRHDFNIASVIPPESIIILSGGIILTITCELSMPRIFPS